VCSQNKRAKRATHIQAGLRGMLGRWQLLTITLRHREGMRLQKLMAGLMKAWRRARQGGKIQRIWAERVTGSVRAVEVTYGENGWHPHIHVLLRTSEWDDEEKQALLERWQGCIRGELGAACVPSDVHALSWSDAFDASESAERAKYVTKIGLEVAGLGKSTSHWQIAKLATLGDPHAMRLWAEFFDATRGRRMIEQDDRVAHAAKLQLAEDRLEAHDLADDFEPLRFDVSGTDFRLLRFKERSHPTIMADVLHSAEHEGRKGVESWLAYARSRKDDPHGSTESHLPAIRGATCEAFAP